MSIRQFVSLDRKAVLKGFRRMRRTLLPAPLFYLLLTLLQAMPGSRESAAQQSFDSIGHGKMAQAHNADRQKKLVADTNKLLNLATELNAELSHANIASLTPDQVRKVAEMKKLAHSVREKMSTAWTEPAPSSFSIVYRPD